MLKDSLGGNCKTTMVANIWPETKMIDETASTLRFATRMMRVSNEATVNIQLDPALLIRKYERQIKDLKQELAMHDTLAGRSRVMYEEYTPDESQELEDKVKNYLDGEIQEIEVVSLRMVYEAFTIFRKLHQGVRTELAQRPDMAAGGRGSVQDASGGVISPTGDELERKEGEVGEDEDGRGIAVGVAPSGLRPVGDRTGLGDGEDEDEGDASAERRGTAHGPGDDDKAPDKQACFADWKSREGIAFEEAFERNRGELKEKRAEMREALVTANGKKREIDEAKERISRKRADKDAVGAAGDEEMIDEEEYALIKNLKDLKQQYRDSFERHKSLKIDVIQIEHLMQQCKTRLVQAFEDWFHQKYGSVDRPAKQQGSPARSARGGQDAGERYDPQEQFDLMEAERLETQHPDALAYHKARKNAARDVRQAKRVGAR